MPVKVAILPWGNVVEDFLDTIGVTLHSFATEMSGGWLFGYAAALRAAGIVPCVIVVSRQARIIGRIVNPTTGLVTVVLPASLGFRVLSALLGDPDAAGTRGGLRAALHPFVSYAATPAGALARALASEAITHVICQEYENPRFDVAAQVARRCGCRIFASFQGGNTPPSRWEQRRRTRSIAGADGLIIAPGTEIARVRTTYALPSERIAQIPNPLDLEEWQPVPRAGARVTGGLPATAIIAICHCRIDYRRKGIDILIAAWRCLVARHPDLDLRLHLIGSGAGDADLQAEIDRAPVPGLRWVRQYSQDRTEMRRELSAADFYVLASRHEGFPVAPLEAMACGLPVILSTAPGCAEILERGEADGGVITPSEDVKALCQEMAQMVLDDTRRARLAIAARRRVEALASVPGVGRQLAEFLTRDSLAP